LIKTGDKFDARRLRFGSVPVILAQTSRRAAIGPISQGAWPSR